jgi:hypothetical protein
MKSKIPDDQNDGPAVRVDTKRRSTAYLKLIKFLEEHPIRGPALLLLPIMLIVGILGWLAGGLRPPSFKYVADASREAYLDLFGGEQQLEEATEISRDLARFTDDYDAFDVAATALYSVTLSRKKFESVLKMPDGKVRILVLDPRLAFDGAGKAQFIALSSEFGDPPELMLAQCLTSTFALSALAGDFKPKYGQRFEVRFYRTAYPEASRTGHFLLGRSAQRYHLHDANRRFDFIVPYDNPAESGKDSPFRLAWRIKDRPENAKVQRYTAQFRDVWSSASPMEEVLNSLPSLLTLTTR